MNEMNLMNNEEVLVMEEPMVETMVEETSEESKGNNVLPVVLGAAAIGAGVILYKKVLEPRLLDMAINYAVKRGLKIVDETIEEHQEPTDSNVIDIQAEK